LSVEQFAEWQAFEALEPFGGLRDDLRFAKVVAAIFNNSFGRTKDSPTVKPQDVFDSLAPDPLAPQTPEEMLATMGGGKKANRGKNGPPKGPTKG
jgi:hypothetical protein